MQGNEMDHEKKTTKTAENVGEEEENQLEREQDDLVSGKDRENEKNKEDWLQKNWESVKRSVQMCQDHVVMGEEDMAKVEIQKMIKACQEERDEKMKKKWENAEREVRNLENCMEKEIINAQKDMKKKLQQYSKLSDRQKDVMISPTVILKKKLEIQIEILKEIMEKEIEYGESSSSGKSISAETEEIMKMLEEIDIHDSETLKMYLEETTKEETEKEKENKRLKLQIGQKEKELEELEMEKVEWRSEKEVLEEEIQQMKKKMEEQKKLMTDAHRLKEENLFLKGQITGLKDAGKSKEGQKGAGSRNQDEEER